MRRVSSIAILIAALCVSTTPVTAEVNQTFSWAGGIEDTFIPQAKEHLRPLEEYELTQHYTQWKEDIDRAASLGITKLRWGIPWYKVEPKEGDYDWKWIDQVMDYMINQKHIDPIVDLVHYGTPVWMENSFADPNYSKYVSDYARAFAKRYGKMVRFYTPLNEPTVNADFAGRQAEWPPYLTGDQGYVAVLLNIAKGIQQTVKAIKQEDPDAVFVAVEAMRWVDPSTDAQRAHLEFLKDMLPFDLVRGEVGPTHELYDWLLSNGASASTLTDLAKNKVHEDIFGVNYYPWSSLAVVDGKLKQGSTHGRLLYDLMYACATHSQRPLFVTETSAPGTVTERALWMAETIDAVRTARARGINVIGYTWFPIISMIDWEYRKGTKPVDQYLLHLGFWDSKFNDKNELVRSPTDLVSNYADWVKRGMTPIR